MEEERKTQFHGALFYSERINEILKAINTIRLSEADNYNNRSMLNIWQKKYELINGLFSELYGKMNDKERKEHKNGKEVVKIYFLNAKNSYLAGKKTPMFFLDLFDEWELELRALAEKKGLIMPDRERETGL